MARALNGQILAPEMKIAILEILNDLRKYREQFGFKNLQAIGLMELSEDLALILNYESYIPLRVELEKLASQLRNKIIEASNKDGIEPDFVEEMRWNLSVLQQMSGLYNLAYPQDPYPYAVSGELIRDFFNLVRKRE